jgi:acyl carrier protein
MSIRNYVQELSQLIATYGNRVSERVPIGINEKLSHHLDSFALLSLLMEIESRYSISLPEHFFENENVQTINLLASELDALISDGSV